jgi:hypothetical protein
MKASFSALPPSSSHRSESDAHDLVDVTFMIHPEALLIDIKLGAALRSSPGY